MISNFCLTGFSPYTLAIGVVDFIFRRILRRYGLFTTTCGVTAISILLSVGITWTITAVLGGGPLGEGLIIAIIAPLVIAPLMSWQIIGLLVKLDQAERGCRS
jgi:hypothetical protein